MIIRRPLLIACLCLLGVDTVSAAQSAPVSGVIRFSGQIVETSCMASGRAIFLSICLTARRQALGRFSR